MDDQWFQVQAKLIRAFVERRGIHEDEFEAFHSYIPRILDMFKEHVKVQYVDIHDHLHTVIAKDVYFVRPMERGIGFDNPERACLRNAYEGEVRGTMLYTISIRPSARDHFAEDTEFEVKEDANFPAEEASEEEEEDEEPEEDEPDEEEEDPEEEEEEEDKESEKPKEKSAFRFTKESYSEYNQIIHSVESHNFLIVEDFPIWIRSTLCTTRMPWCPPSLYTRQNMMGATFMVGRNFKICPYEEYIINNRPLSQKQDKVEMRCRFYNLSKYGRTNSTIRSTLDHPQYRKKQQQKRDVDQMQKGKQPPRFMVEIPHEKPKRKLPVAVLAMAFGCPIQLFIEKIKMYLRDNGQAATMLLSMIEHDVDGCQTQHDAIRRIANCLARCRDMGSLEEKMSYVSYTLHGEFIPNLMDPRSEQNGYEYENSRKSFALAEATAELIRISELNNLNKPDHEQWHPYDRRSYVFKRTDTPGEKLAILTRKYAKHYAKRACTQLKKVLESGQRWDLTHIFNSKLIKLSTSVKNGQWDSKTDTSDHNQNKTQLMVAGFNSDSAHLQMSKIIKSNQTKSTDPKPLLTDPTQLGRVDLYVTPESEKCAIIRHKAPTAVISPLMDMEAVQLSIHRLIQSHQAKLGWIPLNHSQGGIQLPQGVIVHDVFGGVIGWVANGFDMYDLFVSFRRRSLLHPYVTFVYEARRHIFFFNVDEGRFLRPLLVASALPRLWECVANPAFDCVADPVKELLAAGCVEYLDAAEEYCGLLTTAETMDHWKQAPDLYTHVEISALFSMTLTDAKPFANLNAGPRRNLTGTFEKRSLGLKMYPDRGTTSSYTLMYGQTPVISDPYDDAMQLRIKEPNGIHAKVAILSDAFNVEDAWTMKKSFFGRGAGHSSEIHVVTGTLNQGQVFRKPDSRTNGKASHDKYDALLDDGTPRIGAEIKGGAAVLGKVFEHKKGSVISRRCMSKFTPHGSRYVVQAVDKYPEHEKNPKIVRVELRKDHEPTIGDKFFLAHGQKGTVGRIIPDHDLPFDERTGIIPDVFLNACSMFRLTEGLLLEMIMDAARAMSPSLLAQCESVFLTQGQMERKLKAVRTIFNRFALHPDGTSIMRQGTTGEMIMCPVFSGTVYLRVLKQMSADKLRSRDRGPVNDITRQPTSGQKNSGGLR